MPDLWKKLLVYLQRTLPYLVRLAPLLERRAERDGPELELRLTRLAVYEGRLRLLLLLDAAGLLPAAAAAAAVFYVGARRACLVCLILCFLAGLLLLGSLAACLRGLLARAPSPGGRTEAAARLEGLDAYLSVVAVSWRTGLLLWAGAFVTGLAALLLTAILV
jgi:hypothetical protein